MLKKRLIPVLFLKNGLIVRSQGFHDFREMGNPVSQLERLNDWRADELIYVDITRSGDYDLKRDDLKFTLTNDIITILKDISRKCFMPLTFGGRLRTLTDAELFIQSGADKVIVNTAAYERPELISEIAQKFGQQCVVVGIDVKFEGDSRFMYIQQGAQRVEEDPIAWAKRAVEYGAGEIFLNSIDRDGSANGYDLDYIDQMADSIKVPLIACGGAGCFEDFEDVLKKTKASAAAAGNIFNFSENAYLRAKKHLISTGCNVVSIHQNMEAFK